VVRPTIPAASSALAGRVAADWRQSQAPAGHEARAMAGLYGHSRALVSTEPCALLQLAGVLPQPAI
jgi:hypothetical protein